uniref:Uncharacterized protein n=1 Tax=Oryza brachyantha TaxID=4533 RepID=J3LS15_ORYBR
LHFFILLFLFVLVSNLETKIPLATIFTIRPALSLSSLFLLPSSVGCISFSVFLSGWLSSTLVVALTLDLSLSLLHKGMCMHECLSRASIAGAPAITPTSTG